MFSRHTDGYLDEAFPYDVVVKHIEQQGFSLPTEDEWEYLCGGGTKRLFGDYIDEEFIRDICTAQQLSWNSISDRESVRRPSGRGVYIAYNDWTFELVDAPCLVKGADGGVASCGGYSVLSLLNLSPHYRLLYLDELLGPNRWFEDEVYARRVLRLDSLIR